MAASAGRRARDALLTIAAVLGALALASAVAAAILGLTPLVFRSGSMAPAIDTGDLAISRSVDAAAVREGDIVSVISGSGTRITHRVVAVAGSGEVREFTLKGDDNDAPDAEIYSAASVDKVLFSVPKAGYVVMAARSPAGLVVLGAYVAAMLGLVLRREPGDRTSGGPGGAATRRRAGSRRGTPRRSARASARSALVLTVGCALVAGPAAVAAPWTDGVTVTGPAFTAHAVLPPDTATCSNASPSATISWPEKSSLYDYEVVLKRNGVVISTTQVTGSAVSRTFTAAGDFNLGLLAIGNYDHTVEVRSYLAGTPAWRGADVVVATQRIRVSVVQIALSLIASTSCIT